MKITSIIAIYTLFWVMSVFLLLPFRLYTSKDAVSEKVAGQAYGAPATFKPAKLFWGATLLAAILCALFVANFINEWVTFNDLNLFGEPPGWERSTEIG